MVRIEAPTQESAKSERYQFADFRTSGSSTEAFWTREALNHSLLAYYRCRCSSSRKWSDMMASTKGIRTIKVQSASLEEVEIVSLRVTIIWVLVQFDVPLRLSQRMKAADMKFK